MSKLKNKSLTFESLSRDSQNSNLTSLLIKIVETQSAGLLALDRSGRILLSNGKVEQHLGLPDQAQPKASSHWRDVMLHPNSLVTDVKRAEELFAKAQSDEQVSQRVEIDTVDNRILEFEFTPLRIDESYQGHTINCRDITDKHRSDLLIEFQRLQMIESQKFIALGEMASGMAHELNNPMAIIYGRALHIGEIANSGLNEPSKIANYARHIVEVSQRVIKIISGLRGISRDGGQDPLERENVQNLLESVLAFSATKIHLAGIELRLSVSEPELSVKCRAVQTSQILLNLINNAIDAVAGTPAKWISIEAFAVFDEIILAVADSGPGIPVELREKIFVPFFTTKPSQKGTGLGLSVSRNLAIAQGGDLQLDGAARHTRFILRLPNSTS